MCLRVPDAILTGDTLFIGSSGRTDFPGGDAGAQYDAVTQWLFAPPGETVVWPGPDFKGQRCSTMDRERSSNPRFANTTREEYIEYIEKMGELGLPFPDRIQEVLQVNQSGFEAEEVHFPRVADIAEVPEVEAPALAKQLRSDKPPLVLDVREPEEYVGELGHIEGAILVPLDALEIRLPKLAGYIGREIVVVCRAGARSATGASILQHAGVPHVTNLHGGMLAWARASMPVQR